MANQIGEIFLASTHRIGMKVETNPGTAESLADADYKYLCFNIKVVPKIDENKRKYAYGDPLPLQSVMGAQMVTISFDMHMQGSGVTGQDPTIFTPLSACGFQLGANSLFRYAALGLPNKTLTIGFEQQENVASSIRGRKYLLKGAGGTKLTWHFDGSGQMQIASFTMDAALYSISDLTAGQLAVPVLTADTGVPSSVLGITCSYTPTGGSAYPLTTNTMTVDFGLKSKLVEYVQDGTGYAYTVVTDYDPMIDVNILMPLEASLGVYSQLTSTVVLGQFDATLGTAQYKELEIIAAKVQIVKGEEVGDRDGIDSENLQFLVTKPASGDAIGIYQHIT